jgi:hypothetical protein
MSGPIDILATARRLGGLAREHARLAETLNSIVALLRQYARDEQSLRGVFQVDVPAAAEREQED